MKHLRVYFTSVIYEQSAGAKPKLQQLILRMYFTIMYFVLYVFYKQILLIYKQFLQVIFQEKFHRIHFCKLVKIS